MYTKQQEKVLEEFANLSDQLFDLGVTTTDSFTGEIGEFIACRMFNLEKTAKVTRAVDGLSKTGEKYQVKAKVTSGNFSYTIKKLEPKLFDYLVVVYFDELYNPIKIIRAKSRQIKNGEIRISGSNMHLFEHFEPSKIK